jgi:transcriptional regulator GlxA family with amidase domain
MRSASCHPAVRAGLEAMAHETAAPPIRDIVASTGLSHRRFAELFARQVGLTPKVHARIQRFQRARRMAGACSRPDWSSIAALSGYSDQAHLSRDFGLFSGLTPTSYLREQGKPVVPNHVPA